MSTNFEHSESGNWNVAESWSTLMIFQPFQEAGKYLTMAKKGCSDIEEEFQFDEETKIKTRLLALKWSRDKIEEGIKNSFFAVNTGDQKIVLEYLKEILDLDEVKEGQEKSIIDSVELRTINRDSYKISVNEELFNIVYKCLNRIFMQVLVPLNRSDLIFMFKEKFDKDSFKENVKKRFIEGD